MEYIIALEMILLMEYFVFGTAVASPEAHDLRQEMVQITGKNEDCLLWTQVCLVFMSLLIVIFFSPSCLAEAVKECLL